MDTGGSLDGIQCVCRYWRWVGEDAMCMQVLEVTLGDTVCMWVGGNTVCLWVVCGYL